MDLFIETPERTAERLERERRLQETWMASLRQGEGGARRTQGDEVPEVYGAAEVGCRASEAGHSTPDERVQERSRERWSCDELPAKTRRFGRRRRREKDVRAKAESYSVAQEAYRDELAYDKRRARRRKLFAVVRAIGLLFGIPLLLVAVFAGSYVFTCIINGATPEEVVELLSDMVTRCVLFFTQIGWGS